MIILDLQQRSQEWLAYKEERISGTKIGKLFARSRKSDEMFDTSKPNMQFYQILAERLSAGSQDGIDEVSAMQRGADLEPEAIERVSKWLGKPIKTDGVWVDDENPHFMCSPDGYEDSDKPAWAVEVKCLSSANHIKAIYEDEFPSEYLYQVLNYFLVNERLETLYFAMYDPRFFNEDLQLKVFTFNRADVEDQVEQLKFARGEAEKKINDFVEKVSF